MQLRDIYITRAILLELRVSFNVFFYFQRHFAPFENTFSNDEKVSLIFIGLHCILGWLTRDVVPAGGVHLSWEKFQSDDRVDDDDEEHEQRDVQQRYHGP